MPLIGIGYYTTMMEQWIIAIALSCFDRTVNLFNGKMEYCDGIMDHHERTVNHYSLTVNCYDSKMDNCDVLIRNKTVNYCDKADINLIHFNKR